MNDLDYIIEETVGTLAEYDSGWKLELNRIKWGDNPTRFDIRRWSEDRDKMSKGIVLTDEEMDRLKDILDDADVKSTNDKPIYVKNKRDIVNLLKPFANSKIEHFVVIGVGEVFNETKCEVVFIEDFAVDNSETKASYYPRSVFKKLLQEDCTGFFVAHNHPGYEILAPSSEDLHTTNFLTRLGNQLNCPLIDHLIFNNQLKFYSMAKNQLMDVPDDAADVVSDNMLCKSIAKWACDKVQKEKKGGK